MKLKELKQVVDNLMAYSDDEVQLDLYTMVGDNGNEMIVTSMNVLEAKVDFRSKCIIFTINSKGEYK